MEVIRVAVTGAHGKMGRVAVRAIHGDPELELVAAIGRRHLGEDAGVVANGAPAGVPITGDLARALAERPAAVLVDFTHAAAALEHVRIAVAAGVRPVVGATGFSLEDLESIRRLCRKAGVGGAVIPNFSIGAVIWMRLAEDAARYFPEVELIEAHHAEKRDAPSGTATLAARRIALARRAAAQDGPRAGSAGGNGGFVPAGPGPEARGHAVEGIPVHSVRLPGMVAHHVAVFGGVGQTLTLRHDSTSRESFMPGLLLAIKRIPRRNDVVFRLDDLLDA